jgi:hypothetical protein
MNEGGVTAADAPALLSEPAPSLVESFDGPVRESHRAAANQVVHRLTYLRKEEFDDLPIGLLTLSKAWRDLRAVDALDPQLLEAYLDSTDTAEKEVIRFCLRTRGLLASLEHSGDDDFFRQVSAAIDRYPLTLAEASPAQLERFRRAGLVSASFDPGSQKTTVGHCTQASDAVAPRYTLAQGRFLAEGPLPGSQGNSLDLGLDRDTGEPVIITKLFVADSEAIPARAELALAHAGVAPLLYLGRERLDEGLANVLVEALPRASRSDHSVPLAVSRAIALADRIAAILETVHATNRCIVGLRPELTFVDPADRVTLAPRGDLLRNLSWPEGPAIEGQLPPFAETYLALEVLMGAQPSPASDVYSLCAMLAYWVQGRHPFVRGSAMAQLQAMMNESPDCDSLPEPLSAVIARGLSPDAQRRPTVAELRRAFRTN